MRDMVRELGIGDNVSFLGSRSDVSELQGIMDVFCLTSLKEWLPISLIEAMAAGFPVVGSNVEGIRDVIRPATVEPRNVEALQKYPDGFAQTSRLSREIRLGCSPDGGRKVLA